MGFTEISTGLPNSGDFSYIALGDFNSDGDIDFATGGEDYGAVNTVGLRAFTGNGGTSWSSAATGLWTDNSWGGLAIIDTDGDGKLELYATDEHWGTDNNSGLKAWEYRNNKWTDSKSRVTTPATSGRPNNVVIVNITGDKELDLLLCNRSSIDYYENKGGNPTKWNERSGGFKTNSEFTAAAVLDMNKDGLKDIVACDYADGEHMYIQKASGTLWKEYSSGLSTSGNCLGVALGDVNSDSHNDIVFGRRDNGLVCLLGNSGGANGTAFSWTSANIGLPKLSNSGRFCQIQLVDIDLDGDLDIIAPEGRNRNGIQIYLGNGSDNPGKNLAWTKATNTNLPQSGDWYGVNCYDINEDGSMDLIGAGWGNGVKAWLNNISAVGDQTPPGAINDLSVVNVTNNSITIKWSAPADNGTNVLSGPVRDYDIRYSKYQITPSNWANATQCLNEPDPESPETEQSYKITGLSQNTTYYIAIRSIDEEPNISPLSNIVTKKTRALKDRIPPGAVNDLYTSNVGTDRITINWTAPADNGSDISSGPVKRYDIRYSINPITLSSWPTNIKCTGEPVPESPRTPQGFTITGLSQNTTYYIGIRSYDERPNISPLSNIVFNRTKPIIDTTPPGTITNLTVSNTNIDSISINWTAPCDNGTDITSGLVRAYDIRYSKNLITLANWANAIKCLGEPKPEIPETPQVYTIISLSQNTTYYICIRSRDETPNISPLSNIAINKTKPLIDMIPPGAVFDIIVTNITTESITINWTAPANNESEIMSGPAKGYDIRYSTSQITLSNWANATKCFGEPIPEFPGFQQGFKITGLLPDTTYYIALRSYDEKPNISPLSNIASNKTEPIIDTTPPGAISDLMITNITSVKISINWSAPSDNGSDISSGPVLNYDIRYSKTIITKITWKNAIQCTGEPSPEAPGTTQEFNITGLSPGTLYYIVIRSRDEKPSISPLSNLVINTTLGIVDTTHPGQIIDLLAENPTNNSINLTWTAPADNGSNASSGPVTEYNIRYHTVPITNATWPLATKCNHIPKIPGNPDSNEVYTVIGLQAETTYYFAIKARDERPNWAWISNTPFNTTAVDPDVIPPGAISDLQAFNPTLTSINLTWTATGDDGYIGNATYYDLRYSTIPITDQTWSSAIQCLNEPDPNSSGETEYYQITNLNPGIRYYFAIRVGDETSLWSELSNLAWNSTLPVPDTTQPGQIIDLRAENPTNNSINLSWTAPADNGSNMGSGPVYQYDIRFYTAPITNATWSIATKYNVPKIPGNPGSIETFKVTGLSAETIYYFAIKSRDENDNWAYISNNPFNTTLVDPDITPPSVVSDLKAYNPTFTTINLTWTATGDDGNSGNASYYDIRYSKRPITQPTWSSAKQCVNEPLPSNSGITEYYQVIGLRPDVRYYFAIRVGDETPLWSEISNEAWNTTIPIPDTTPPGKINNLLAINPTNNSINLTWTAPPDNSSEPNSGSVTEYDIRFYTSPITNSTWSIATKCMEPYNPGLPGASEKYTVTGLSEMTMYYFAIKARDEEYNWAWISNCLFNTTLENPDIMPPERVSDLLIVKRTQISIDLTWTASGDDGNSGNATYYDVRYSKKSIKEQNWLSATQLINEPKPKSSGETEYYQVIGLKPDTKYYFAIKVGDETPLWSELSNIASNTTLRPPDDTPPGKIMDLSISKTTKSSINLTWTAPGDDCYSGKVMGYEIKYNTIPITETLWSSSNLTISSPEPLSSGKKQTYMVTGLIPSQKYYFAVKAYDDRPNFSTISNIAEGNTKSRFDITPPNAVIDLAAFTLSPTSVKLTWTAPGDDGMIDSATGYDIRYSKSPITYDNWYYANHCNNLPKPQNPGYKEVYLVTGLFAATEYYFALITFDEIPNHSNLSNIANATTYASDDSIPPAEISDLSVVEISETSVTLTWTATGDDGFNGSATTYDLRFGLAQITAENWQRMKRITGLHTPKSADEIEIFLYTGLDPGTTYYFAICTGDEVPNWSPISNCVKATTIETVKSKIGITLIPEKDTIISNESIYLTIKTFDLQSQLPIELAKVSLHTYNLDLIITPVFGETDDEGKIIVTIIAPYVKNPTEIKIFVEVEKANYTSKVSMVTVLVEPPGKTQDKPEEKKFNLYINDSEITFSKRVLYNEDEVKIYALITNIGDCSASKFCVRFYINNVPLSDDFYYKYLEKDGFILVERSWSLVKGNYSLKVEIIPQEPKLESDDSDNTAEIDVSIIDQIIIDKKDDVDIKDNGTIDNIDDKNKTDGKDKIDDKKDDDIIDDKDKKDDSVKDDTDKNKDIIDNQDDTANPNNDKSKEKDNLFSPFFLELMLIFVILIVGIIIITGLIIRITRPEKTLMKKQDSEVGGTSVDDEPVEVVPVEEDIKSDVEILEAEILSNRYGQIFYEEPVEVEPILDNMVFELVDIDTLENDVEESSVDKDDRIPS